MGNLFVRAVQRSLLGLLILGAAVIFVLSDFLLTDYPLFQGLEVWSLIFGYLGFILIAVTLVIGPVKQWLPASWSGHLLRLRRDIGIAGGLAAIMHVVLVFLMFARGTKLMIIGEETRQKEWWRLFIEHYPDGSVFPNFSVTGLANYMGAIGILIVLAMTLTSSSRAERQLGGASWKRLHLGNLLVFILVSFHAIIYVGAIKGSPHNYADILWVTAFVLLLRLIAFWWTVGKRRRNRKEPVS